MYVAAVLGAWLYYTSGSYIFCGFASHLNVSAHDQGSDTSEGHVYNQFIVNAKCGVIIWHLFKETSIYNYRIFVLQCLFNYFIAMFM